MKKICIFTLSLCCLWLPACNSDHSDFIYEPMDVRSTITSASATNISIIVFGDFLTGSEHSISLTSMSTLVSSIYIAGDGDGYQITSSEPGYIKAFFTKAGTYNIRVLKEGRRGANEVLAEREIEILGYDFVALYQYKAVNAPKDYWITPTNHGLSYFKNGIREMVGGSIIPRSGHIANNDTITRFYAIFNPTEQYYPVGPVTSISERIWRRYPDDFYPMPNYTAYSYSTNRQPEETDVPGSLVQDKFYIFATQKQGTVPLYSIKKRQYDWSNARGMMILSSEFNYLSTVNEVTQMTVTERGPGPGDDYIVRTYPGVIVGYVFPVSRRRAAEPM